MSRRTWFWVCGILGLVMLVGGWLVPMHLRAVDARVIARAGRNTPALSAQGLALVNQKELGAAQLLLQAGRQEGFPDWEELGLAVNNLAKQAGDAKAAVRARVLGSDSTREQFALPLTEVVIRGDNRQRTLDSLRSSPRPAVQALLRCRALTNTVVFYPSQSASGQALDAAISICGLLLDEGRLTPALSNRVFALASQAGFDSQPLEEVLMEMMSLGQRLNWSQLAVFTSRIQDTATLRVLTDSVRRADDQLPVIFSAVQLSGQPEAVAKYLTSFSRTGLRDLGASLRFGTGGINELLRRNQRLYDSNVQKHIAEKAPLSAFSGVALDLAWRQPWQALALRWFLFLAGGFLFAVAMHFAWPAVSPLERPLQVRGFHFAREVLFALGFLLVVLLLSEPFLAQESQKVEFPFRLRLPMVGSTAPAGIANVKTTIMNQVSSLSLMTLLLFFVLQALIYTACLVKLAEIRRQKVPARIKLKLLENEDHLFDAGLYLGFVGTIISLILVSLGVVQFSLMAAYSSTSFGIIFVSFFKIFHLRPARRKLLLEAEAMPAEPAAPSPAPRAAFATAP